MTVPVDHVTAAETRWSALDTDFQTTCGELSRARLGQRSQDTPANRAAALTRVDAVLDTYLDVQGYLRRADSG